MGAISGVTFNLTDVADAHPRQSLLAEACVEKTCDTLNVGRAERQTELTVGGDVVTDDSPVSVTLAVRDQQGSTVFVGDLEVVPEKQQPNGPGCPPTTWRAQVSASGDNGLRQDVTSPN